MQETLDRLRRERKPAKRTEKRIVMSEHISSFDKAIAAQVKSLRKKTSSAKKAARNVTRKSISRVKNWSSLSKRIKSKLRASGYS